MGKTSCGVLQDVFFDVGRIIWLELMEFGFLNICGDLYVDLALIWILSMHDLDFLTVLVH
ncbi:hypothetical protein B14911_10177 [Bacillus sp. NRRL B-14911]|uniref:Uncharacterized protein n=1 Tax=Bacillus infantis NRRL B-14911 TaxID=1367477 RepID=U5LBW2_9BACI|nr:hypothetical protein N288_10900 [Bacillus infantis NRRL B-14911]EAR65934.1 hypothetical protein B14911_10177 [Bacillus sp. NRRL B-14911]